MTVHIAKSGETVNSVSQLYNISPEQIIIDNGLNDPSKLAVGQALIILPREKVITVTPGDTLFSIATQNDISVNQLLRNNPQLEGNADNITVGQSITIKYEGTKRGSISTNGYAYANINKDILRRTLPYLTYITLFTYGFTTSGELIEIDDREIVSIAREYGTAPIMLISSYTEEGSFSNELTNALLNDENLQDILIENIIANMRDKGYYGLDVDFEYVYDYDAEPYVEFIEKLTSVLNEEGYPVWVALAPKTSADQPGLLYQGHNYSGLGAAANYLLIMTYEWGYSFSPPMAVAPINKVEEVIDFAVSQIDKCKIFMGIPNYGYNWNIPFERGTAAPSIGNTEAVELAARENAEIFFDTTAMSPYFTYTSDEQSHEVWFEDARSIEAKLTLIKSQSLSGGSWWNIMRWFAQNWVITNALCDIERISL